MKKNNPAYLWPSWYLSSFPKTQRLKISAIVLNKLAKGQDYLWEALNIYDDILDGSKDAGELPYANRYFRLFLEIYYRLNLSPEFYKIFNTLLSDLENANREEFIRKKFPRSYKLENLSKKSLALCAGPLAILFLIANQSEAKTSGLVNFFRFALAAKQLSDDAKDWFEDLSEGAITYPINLIMEKAKKGNIELNLKKKPELAYLLFAQVAPKIGHEIGFLCGYARQEARKINLPQNSPLLLNIILPLEKAVLKAERFNKLLA